MQTKQQADDVHEDFEQFAAREFGVVTVDQYRFGLACYQGGRRDERGQHARLHVIQNDAVGAIARAAFDQYAPSIAQSMEQHAADGEGRN